MCPYIFPISIQIALGPRRYGHREYVDILDFVNLVKLVASTWKRCCFVNSAIENHIYCDLLKASRFAFYESRHSVRGKDFCYLGTVCG